LVAGRGLLESVFFFYFFLRPMAALRQFLQHLCVAHAGFRPVRTFGARRKAEHYGGNGNNRKGIKCHGLKLVIGCFECELCFRRFKIALGCAQHDT
jgi:hypothetical protein